MALYPQIQLNIQLLCLYTAKKILKYRENQSAQYTEKAAGQKKKD